MKNINKVDSFLPNSLNRHVLEILNSSNFPWFFCANASFKSEELGENFSFSHTPFNSDREENSEYMKNFLPIIYFIEDKFKIDVENVMRIRIGLNLYFDNKKIINPPHVDYHVPHYTLLYYPEDSDGDTVFYNEKFEGNEEIKEVKNFTVNTTITPKQNSAVLFNGLIYHSSSKPQKFLKRTAININFQTKEQVLMTQFGDF